MSQVETKLNRDFKGIWIDRDIWLNKNLSIHAKALWAEIDSLYDPEKGGCYASDEYLSEFMQVKRSRLQEIIKELMDKGYLVRISSNGRRVVRRAVMPERGHQMSANPDTCYPENRTSPVRKAGSPLYIENKDKKKDNIAQTTHSATPIRGRDPSFSFDSGKFEDVSKEDLEKWKELYPEVNIKNEILRMEEWCLSNKSKAKSKKKWRQFITGWLQRANDTAVNKQAFKHAKGAVERRTLDVSGKPMENPLEGRF